MVRSIIFGKYNFVEVRCLGLRSTVQHSLTFGKPLQCTFTSSTVRTDSSRKFNAVGFGVQKEPIWTLWGPFTVGGSLSSVVSLLEESTPESVVLYIFSVRTNFRTGSFKYVYFFTINNLPGRKTHKKFIFSKDLLLISIVTWFYFNFILSYFNFKRQMSIYIDY